LQRVTWTQHRLLGFNWALAKGSLRRFHWTSEQALVGFIALCIG
jgi:hypothetical protein